MLYEPYSASTINLVNGTYTPSMNKSINNATFAYWERALFQRASYSFKFNFPEEWNRSKDFILYCLFKLGYVMVAEDDTYGLFAQPVSVSGYDFNYQPIKALLSNPALPSTREYEIGKDCELMKLTPDYMGIWDIIYYHAERLSEIDKSINQALVNTKFAWMAFAKNKSSAEALKKALDLINEGQPAVVVDKLINAKGTMDRDESILIENLADLSSNYIIDKLLRDRQTILNEFDTEIGIATVPYEKKERLITSEVESNKEESQSRITIWKETLDSSLKLINDMFGTNITVELRTQEQPNDIVVEGSEDNAIES